MLSSGCASAPAHSPSIFLSRPMPAALAAVRPKSEFGHRPTAATMLCWHFHRCSNPQAHQLILHLQPLTHSTRHIQLQDSAVLHSACNRHPNLNLNLIPISISSDAHHTSSDKRPQCLLTLITLAFHIYIISHALAHSSTAPCAARAPRPRNISNFREIWLLSRSGPPAGHGARVRGYGRTR